MPRVYISANTQRAVIERAQGRCEYCQSRADYTTESFAVEHIMPVSRGGSSELDNLAFSGCNGHKYNRTEVPDPINRTLVPLYNPRLQRWQDHFCWSDDRAQIIGLTPTGRATVEALKMNRTGLVNMRRCCISSASILPRSTRYSSMGAGVYRTCKHYFATAFRASTPLLERQRIEIECIRTAEDSLEYPTFMADVKGA